MLKKFFDKIGSATNARPAVGQRGGYQPYASAAANATYNLLFCDDASAFVRPDAAEHTPWQTTLMSRDVPALEALAADSGQEGRIRYRACARLRALGADVAPKQLLGVVVEVALDNGLDALAAYDPDNVRYINQTGRTGIFDAVPEFAPLIARLLAAARPVVAAIGPWDQPRLPPPKRGNARLTFLASDGLYFGEGAIQTLQREALGGPVLHAAGILLNAVVDKSSGP